MSLAKMMIPHKFKDYLNLVLGFVLVFLLINPFAVIKNAAGVDGLADALFSMEQTLIRSQAVGAYDKAQTDAVLAEYKMRLEDRLAGLLERSGFEIASAFFEIIDEGEDFGEIVNIHAEVREKSERGASSGGALRIEKPSFEPVRIVIGNGTQPETNEQSDTPSEDVKITGLKKIISDFYNLPTDNIYIKKLN